MSETKSKDQELWKKWKQTRSPMDLEALMKQMAPVLRRETSRWSSIVPATMLENEAKLLAIKAFESYNPRAGTALSTHLVNQLQKLSRMAYARQSSVSVPEQKRLIFNNYNKIKSQLEDVHGRPPTLDEVADHMRLPPKKLQGVIDLVGKREYMESGDGPSFLMFMDDPEVVHLAFHDMTPQQKRIFEMRTGYGGNAVKSGAGIMHELGLTQGQLSYQLNQIKQLLEKAQRLR
jgi:DNA-directed RNA polymerase sigma subunit (sigma70/sigma32)